MRMGHENIWQARGDSSMTPSKGRTCGAANDSTLEGASHMSNQVGSAADIPWRLRVLRRLPFFNAFAQFLLGAGVPLGFNGLVTVRGRKSGLPRTTPVAIIESSGRRWIWAPWGEVQWVRNLRAAGHATITMRRQTQEVSATELDPAQRVGYFRDVLGPLARSIPFGIWFIRIADGVDLNHPVEAAEGRPVFELHSVS
jgi:deazaflavin-dependent oxidoreductase (nitroreductase family)